MDLHDKLLKWAGDAKTSAKFTAEASNSSDLDGQKLKKGSKPKSKLSEEQLLEKLRSRDSSPETRRKFLLRLAVALHSYGSSAPRTEFLMEKAAGRLGLDIHVAVFPALLAIAFPTSNIAKQETHLLTVEADLDVNRLDKADQLANKVGEVGNEALVAYWKLRSIATSAPLYSFWPRQLAFAVLSGTACLLFFNGTLLDGLVATTLGLGVGLLTEMASSHMVVSQVAEFLAATIAAFLARGLASLAPGSFCYYPITLAALVWLLPGLSLTVGVSELVARSYVCGATRVVTALFAATQLGFGMAVGEKLVWWGTPQPATEVCPAPDLSPYWQLLWFLGYSMASNTLLAARLDQWAGMILVSACAWLAATFSSGLGGDASSIVAAFAIGVSGSVFSRLSGQLPMATKTAAILLLVPGGLGVRGVEAILSSDVVSGMSFMFDMFVVGLSITLGLLLAKLFSPSAMWGSSSAGLITQGSLARQLEEEGGWEVEDKYDAEEQETMAI